MSTISRPSSNAADRAAQLQAAQKKMPAQVKEKAAPAQLKALGQIVPRDGLEKTRSMAARLMQEASQGLRAAQASGGNPFSVLAGGLTSGGKPVQVPAEMLRLMAAGQDLSVDASPSDKLMGKLAGVELAVTSLPVKEGIKEGLGVALGKVHQGTMLTLSDAADTHASAGSIPRDVPTQVAETVVEKNLRIGKGLAVAEAKLQNTMTTSLNAVRGRLSAGVDVNALVQAVLRECYLLQNEMLRDFADKVKYYNALKKSVRDKTARWRELSFKLEDGDPLPENLTYWDGERGEWVWFDMQAPPPPQETEEGENIEGAGVSTGAQGATTTPVPVDVDPEQPAAAKVADGDFAKVEPGYGWRASAWPGTDESPGNPGTLTYFLYRLNSPTDHVGHALGEYGGTRTEGLSELAKNVQYMRKPDFLGTVRNLVEGWSYNDNDTADEVAVLNTMVENAYPSQLAYLVQNLSDSELRQLTEASPSFASFRKAYDAALGAAQDAGLLDVPGTQAAVIAYAVYSALPGTDSRRAAALKVLQSEMWSLDARQARSVLSFVASSQPKLAEKLFSACNGKKIFGSGKEKPADWAFLEACGGKAAKFYQGWLKEATRVATEAAETKALNAEMQALPAGFHTSGLDEEVANTELEMRRLYVLHRRNPAGADGESFIAMLKDFPADRQVRYLQAMLSDPGCPPKVMGQAVEAFCETLSALPAEEQLAQLQALEADSNGSPELLSRVLAGLNLEELRTQLDQEGAEWLERAANPNAAAASPPDGQSADGGGLEGSTAATGQVQGGTGAGAGNEPPGPSDPAGSPAGLPPGNQAFSKKASEEYLKTLEESLQTIGDDAQLANTDLQNALQQQQQTLQMMSNISKMLHDTAMAVIRKMGG